MITQIEGLAGLVVQVAIFVLVFFSGPSSNRSQSLFYGAVASIYGYSLVLLLTMFVGIPWGVTNFALLLAVAIVASVFRARLRSFEAPTIFLRQLSNHVPAILIVSAVLFFHIFVAATKPDVSVDGQLYHGPVLAQMIQHGTVWGWSAPSEYLYYSDLTMVSGLNLSTFTGQVLFDDGIQIQHLLVLILALNWALSLRFRSSFVRASLAVLIVSAPVIWLQPRVLYVDLGYGAALASAIFAIVLTRRFSSRDVCIAGIAIGAVLATKPAGVLTSAILVAALVGIILYQQKTRRPTKPLPLRVLAAAIGLPLIAGLGFYLRNQFSFGSPTFPVTTEVGPFRFAGIVDLSVVTGDGSGKTFDPGHLYTYLSGIWKGISGGLLKLDYDPRAGGFGYIPLVVGLAALAFFAVQLIMWRKSTERNTSESSLWRVQLGLGVLCTAVLLIQPASSNARYVIGPTVVLLTALLMTTIGIASRRAEVTIGIFALVATLVQVSWTETNMYPGLKDTRALRTLSATYQPVAPGNPWGRGESVSWLPESNDTCLQIAFENSGGVTSGGLMESTRIATFPYALYGSRLCNSVEPIALKNFLSADGKEIDMYRTNPINNANYLVLHTNHVDSWLKIFKGEESCWVSVATIPGDQDYPQEETVIRNLCAAQ